MRVSSSTTGSTAWPLALAAAALAGTLATACGMPFVAIAVVTVATMTRSSAIVTIGGIWAINQILGFGLLGYPFTPYALAWGAALLVASLGAMLLAATLLERRSHLSPRVAGVFIVAFMAYEAALLAFASIVGGTGTFTPAIVARILANDGAWFAGLVALHLALTRAAPRLFGKGLRLGAA